MNKLIIDEALLKMYTDLAYWLTMAIVSGQGVLRY